MSTPPAKPYPNFPLFAAKSGQWRKDVRVGGGKPRPFYFGSWTDDPTGDRAVREWLDREPAIRAGLDHTGVKAPKHDMTVVELLRRVMQFKQGELLAERIADETFAGYQRDLNGLGEYVGSTATVTAFNTPTAFAGFKTYLEGERQLGPDRVATIIRYTRAAFNHAHEQGWIPAPQFGAGFSPPATDADSKAMRKIRAGQDADAEAMYDGPQVDWLLNRASPLFKAMILLALNCGIGPSDLGRLRWRNIDGKRLSMRRGKTGRRRECYLWKRTRDALERVKSLKHNAALIAKDGGEAFVFVTRKGEPVVRRERIMEGDKVARIKSSSAVSITFGRWIKEAKEAGIIDKGLKIGFYNLRHTYYTIAEDSGDLNAVHRTMGHALAGQGKTYKRRPFPLPRLKKIAMRVHRSLWPKTKEERKAVEPGQLRLVS